MLKTFFDRLFRPLSRMYPAKVVSDFEINDTLPCDDGSVKHKVILIGGQSNGSGSTWVSSLQDRISAEKFEKYSKGFESVPSFFFCDNGGNQSKAFVPTALGQGGQPPVFGPEVGLAEYLSENSTDRYIIIKYAWGGSDMHTQWLSPYSPDCIRNRTGKLYEAFVKFVKLGMDYLRNKGYDAEIVAMCWMQGESDSFRPQHYKKYLVHTAELIRGVRQDLSSYASDDGICFIDAGISDSPLWTHYSHVNDAKRSYAEQDKNAVFIDTIAAGLSVKEDPADNPDLAHYDALSEIELGRLFGQEVLKRAKKNQ